MTRRQPLPDDFVDGPFHVARAREAGIARSRLRAADLSSPTRGVRRIRSKEEAADAEGGSDQDNLTPTQRMQRLSTRLRDDIEGYVVAFTPHQFLSHETGLAVLGCPLPYTTTDRREVHVSVRRPHPLPRRNGVRGHRLQARESARWRAGGLPIEHPARMWRQSASQWGLDDLIVAGDFLIHPRRRLVTLDDLRREVAEAGDVRRLLRAALQEIRSGSESSEESRLRLVLTRAGLPEPVLNMNLVDDSGRFVARLDLAYPKYRVAPEYDGRGHAEAGQFAKDADRWDAIRAQHWQHVRILSHHLRPDPQIAVDKVAVALFDAGWRPGRG
ncbi:hypothetical protein FM104_07815 [Microbacterium esteraromaticum]|uniref:DUF559 domain-containing protein n=1 Tax=Microbacterium esteraromaticum TaxID=57043 RepID=A0A1R4JJL5_9MICO|nr:hypothetical protein [Microbacterium esteraromaticum]SJN32250.1 hypothetical protein FM104_07815 [Microbacterium esteraromaticum]